jgi:hypothetical protein
MLLFNLLPHRRIYHCQTQNQQCPQCSNFWRNGDLYGHTEYPDGQGSGTHRRLLCHHWFGVPQLGLPLHLVLELVQYSALPTDMHTHTHKYIDSTLYSVDQSIVVNRMALIKKPVVGLCCTFGNQYEMDPLFIRSDNCSLSLSLHLICSN